MRMLWGFIKFCLMVLGYSVIAVFTVLDVISIIIALYVILDNNVPETVWKRKDG